VKKFQGGNCPLLPAPMTSCFLQSFKWPEFLMFTTKDKQSHLFVLFTALTLFNENSILPGIMSKYKVLFSPNNQLLTIYVLRHNLSSDSPSAVQYCHINFIFSNHNSRMLLGPSIMRPHKIAKIDPLSVKCRTSSTPLSVRTHHKF